MFSSPCGGLMSLLALLHNVLDKLGKSWDIFGRELSNPRQNRQPPVVLWKVAGRSVLEGDFPPQLVMKAARQCSNYFVLVRGDKPLKWVPGQERMSKKYKCVHITFLSRDL